MNIRSNIQPTHKVINIKEMKVLLTGTEAECLAFLRGLEYAATNTESVRSSCFLKAI